MFVVLDTNILVSSQLKKHGNEAELLRFRKKNFFDIVVSEEIFQEYAQVMSYPHILKILQWQPHQIQQFLSDLRKIVVFVEVYESSKISIDQNDDKFFHCAKAAQAEYLVSGDEHHILPFRKYGETRILKSKDFLEIMRKKEQKNIVDSVI